MSQLIRHARASNAYEDFLARERLLTNKFLTQGYVKPKLLVVIKEFYGRHKDLVDRYGVSMSEMIRDTFDTT